MFHVNDPDLARSLAGTTDPLPDDQSAVLAVFLTLQLLGLLLAGSIPW